MASRNMRRAARRAGRELAKKKNRGLLITLVIVVLIATVIASVAGFVLWKMGYIDLSEFFVAEEENTGGNFTPPPASEPYVETLAGSVNGEIDIHFLELGNKYTGDCTFIQVGSVDILIDAGSKTSSIPTISAFLNEHMTDDLLDYVIVTHAHEDHYAGFATNDGTNSLFDLYKVGTIIDFAQTNQKSTAKMYNNYLRERDEEIASGAVHYTAKECIDDNNATFSLSENVTMTILNQKYYHEKMSSGENDHSVCVLFSQGDAHYLFTGDLEEKGEKSLAEMNELPEVLLYKAGHHGSKTSSHDVLLNEIKPKVVTVCCCAGSSEYTDTNANQFPTQEFVDRIAPHTQLVYVTTLCLDYKADKAENQYTSMNGNIHVSVINGVMTITCSNSNRILKEWDWFKDNRVMPNAWK